MNDLIILALLFAILYKVSFAKEPKFFQKPLSLENCNAIRGILAIIVVFHHVAQRTDSGLVFKWLENIGFLPVAGFLFFSGYGLMKKHILDQDYHKRFLIKRVPTILVPYIIMTFVYWLYDTCNGEFHNIRQILTFAFIKGDPIVSFSWFVILLLYLYLIFYICMLLCKRRFMVIVLIEFILCVIYVYMCRKLHYGRYWYVSVIAFIIGQLFAYKEIDLLTLFKKHYLVIVSIFSLSMVIILNLPKFLTVLGINKLSEIASSAIFGFLSVLLLMRVDLRNKITCHLGTISFEIYLVHGLPIRFFHSEMLNIRNDFLYLIVVCIVSIILAEAFHKLFKIVLGAYNKCFLFNKPNV